MATITGLSETISHLDRVERGLNDTAVMQLAQGQVHRYLIGLAQDYPPRGLTGVLPVRTGRLKSSFQTPPAQRTASSIIGTVSSNIEYGSIVDAHRGFIAKTVADQERPLNDLFAAYIGRLVVSR